MKGIFLIKIAALSEKICVFCFFFPEQEAKNMSGDQQFLTDVSGKVDSWVVFGQERRVVSEGMSQCHSDLFLPTIGTYLERLSEGGCFHHTGFTCLHTVVHPHTQSETWIAV